MANEAVNNTKFFYSGLPPWARGVILVGAFGLIVYVGFAIKNSIENAKQAKLLNAAAVTAANDLAALKAQGVAPSFISSQYEVWSQTIVDAIGGCISDYDTIFNIFRQMVNKADVLQLIVTFGIRNAQPCGFSTPISYLEYMVDKSQFGGSLPYLLTWGLSSSHLTDLNSILAGLGINYTF